MCENKFDESDSLKDTVHSIGLDIIKKRLELIYPKKHRLTINSNDSTYKVNLEILLDEN